MNKEQFKAAYRLARMGVRMAQPLHVECKAIMGGDRWSAHHLFIAVQRAMAPVGDMRQELRRKVLNGWGSKNAWSGKGILSLRTASGYRLANQAQDLRNRLKAQGRLQVDEGNWATGEILSGHATDKSELSLRDALGKMTLTYQHALWVQGKDPLHSQSLCDAWRAMGTQPDSRFLIREAA